MKSGMNQIIYKSPEIILLIQGKYISDFNKPNGFASLGSAETKSKLYIATFANIIASRQVKSSTKGPRQVQARLQ